MAKLVVIVALCIIGVALSVEQPAAGGAKTDQQGSVPVLKTAEGKWYEVAMSKQFLDLVNKEAFPGKHVKTKKGAPAPTKHSFTCSQAHIKMINETTLEATYIALNDSKVIQSKANLVFDATTLKSANQTQAGNKTADAHAHASEGDRHRGKKKAAESPTVADADLPHFQHIMKEVSTGSDQLKQTLNVTVLHTDKKENATVAVLCAKEKHFSWILSRNNTISDKDFKQYHDLAKKHGCGDLIRIEQKDCGAIANATSTSNSTSPSSGVEEEGHSHSCAADDDECKRRHYRKFEGIWYAIGVSGDDKAVAGLSCMAGNLKAVNDTTVTADYKGIDDTTAKPVSAKAAYVFHRKQHGRKQHMRTAAASASDDGDTGFVIPKHKMTYEHIIMESDLDQPDERRDQMLEVLAFGPTKQHMQFALSCNRDQKSLVLMSRTKTMDSNLFAKLADLAKQEDCGTLTNVRQDNCPAFFENIQTGRDLPEFERNQAARLKSGLRSEDV